jgi:hypothetical protein
MNREDQAPKASGSYIASRIFNVQPLACNPGASLSRMTATLPGDPSVLHKCANPACPSLFRSLNLGKLFPLDRDSSVAGASGTSPVNRRARSVRQVERSWLCDGCSSLLTLTFERGRGNGYSSASG